MYVIFITAILLNKLWINIRELINQQTRALMFVKLSLAVTVWKTDTYKRYITWRENIFTHMSKIDICSMLQYSHHQCYCPAMYIMYYIEVVLFAMIVIFITMTRDLVIFITQCRHFVIHCHKNWIYSIPSYIIKTSHTSHNSIHEVTNHVSNNIKIYMNRVIAGTTKRCCHRMDHIALE
jgi:hypothetical protein